MVEAIGENFPGNSYNKSSGKKKTPATPEEERKPLEKVISGEVIRRKKGFGSKIKETFTGEDAQSVGSYIFFDVIVPAIQSMLVDSISQGAERMFLGSSTPRRSTSYNRATSGTSYTPYNRMFRPENERREISKRGRATHNFDEIIIDTRAEAEAVLDILTDNIQNFSLTTVSDLYDLVGQSKDYIDDNWGWRNLSQASVRRVPQGYLLVLPPTQYLGQDH